MSLCVFGGDSTSGWQVEMGGEGGQGDDQFVLESGSSEKWRGERWDGEWMGKRSFLGAFQLDLKRGMVVECIIYTQQQKSIIKSMNMYPNCSNYTLNPYVCPQYYPLFNYGFPSLFQNTYTYAQQTYSFLSEIDQPDRRATSHLVTESQTPPILEPLLPHPDTPKEQQKIAKKHKISRAVGKGQAEQKENRNVYSNILRNFFRRVNDKTKIDQLVERIIAKNGLKVTKQGFHEHVRQLKVNHGKYLRFKKLRPFFVDGEDADFALIFRVMFEHLVEGELLIQTLTSRKIGRWSVSLHLRGARELKERLYH